MLYYLFRLTLGQKTLVETSEDVSYLNNRATKLRSKVDTTICNYTVQSQEEVDEEIEVRNRWNALTEEDKHDYIVVDGKKYVRKIWEANHKEVK